MSLDDKQWLAQLDDFPEANECIRKSKKMTDALPSYEYLYGLRGKIPKELYAHCYRELLKYNTANVPVELRLLMFDGVERNDIMFQEEIDAIKKFGENITIYRGTSKTEEKPGIHWSRKRYVAENSDFYRGRLFVANIPTSAILLYMTKEDDEEEIIAHVTTNYRIEDS